MELIEKYNGFITSKKAAAAGINNKKLQRMKKSGDIERVEHVLYMEILTWNSVVQYAAYIEFSEITDILKNFKIEK